MPAYTPRKAACRLRTLRCPVRPFGSGHLSARSRCRRTSALPPLSSRRASPGQSGCPLRIHWSNASFWGAHYRLHHAIQHESEPMRVLEAINTARRRSRRRRCLARGFDASGVVAASLVVGRADARDCGPRRAGPCAYKAYGEPPTCPWIEPPTSSRVRPPLPLQVGQT